MINYLEIENFRSIRKTRIDFESRISVIIGANGSGKTNFIKALEFLSSIARHGLENSIFNFGGMASLLPKTIPISGFPSHPLRLSYKVSLNPPSKNYEDKFALPGVSHELIFKWKRGGQTEVLLDSMTFHEPLAVSHHIVDKNGQSEVRPDSAIRFTKKKGAKRLKIEIMPEVEKKEVSLYLAWLGLPFFKDKINSKSELSNFLNNLRIDAPSQMGKGMKRREKPQTLLDGDSPSPIKFAPQFNRFTQFLSNIRRYDILLNELRREQQSTVRRSLLSDGSNMPSCLRHVKQEDKEAFQRIISTLETLAPHISTTLVSNLRTGKEFVEFTESAKGRSVESWESSDGTLRALAILLAVETMPRWSTIVIEEPEQNLHPWAIRALMDHIRDASKMRDIQVIMTTHSQQVLEAVEPNEVFVAKRSEDLGTEIHPLTELFPHHSIEMGEIGRMWVKGLLGGVPQ